ncbi:nicotinamide riboside transporter PnuC [Bacteroidota bacterium]
MSSSLNWLTNNYIEIIGAVSGLLYLYFSIHQKIWLWPLGIITSGFYIIVFFQSSLYADMSLNVYYVMISMYGWYYWKYGKKKKEKILAIKRLNSVTLTICIGVTVILWIAIVLLLRYIPAKLNISASDMLILDAFTTAASIIATFLLARKYIENWLFWIIIDLISMGMYIYKKLYPTTGLFLVYSVLAWIGYIEWKKNRTNA